MRYRRKMSGAVAVAVFATGASAAVIDRGDYTHDTRTGLRWLDLTASNGLSFNQVSARFGPTGQFAGHRYASLTEVEQLFIGNGIPYAFAQQPVTDDVRDRILLFQSLFGVTSTPDGFGFTRTISTGLTSTASTFNPSNNLIPFLEWVDFDSDAVEDKGSAAAGSRPRNEPAAGVGSWLVLARTDPGWRENTPRSPSARNGLSSAFTAADGLGEWVDPQFDATGYTFATTDGQSKFAAVELPTNTDDGDQMFVVSDAVNGDTTVAAGELYTFAQTVAAFTITGIGPANGAPLPVGDPGTTFPVFVVLDSPTGDYTINAVPEPATFVVMAGLGLVIRRRR